MRYALLVNTINGWFDLAIGMTLNQAIAELCHNLNKPINKGYTFRVICENNENIVLTHIN